MLKDFKNIFFFLKMEIPISQNEGFMTIITMGENRQIVIYLVWFNKVILISTYQAMKDSHNTLYFVLIFTNNLKSVIFALGYGLFHVAPMITSYTHLLHSQNFVHSWEILHHVYTPHFLYPIISWWLTRLVLSLSYYELSC